MMIKKINSCIKQPSFSIIELMIVLSALTVLVAITVPRFLDLKKRALIHDLEYLSMVCSYLQQKAIASHKTLYLTFNQTNQCYVYQGLKNKITTIPLSSGILFGFIEGVKGPPGDPTKAITSSITFESEKQEIYHITFFYDGKISPGTVYLVDTKKKFMGALTCTLSQVSYIRKYLYNKIQWTVL